MKPNEKLRLIRTAKKLSQQQIARQLNISPEAYGKIERGNTPLTIDRANQLAGILDTCPEVFTTHQPISLITDPNGHLQICLQPDRETPAGEPLLETILHDINWIKETLKNLTRLLVQKTKPPRPGKK